MSPIVQVYTLGRFEVVVRGEALADAAWRRRKARQLLKCLLSAPRRRLAKDQAIELLWPESDPEAADTNLRSTVHGLRRALGESGANRAGGLISADRDAVGLRPGADVWVDADAFERALAAARDAADPLPPLEEADALYGGDYLPDDLYEDWAAPRREALKRAWAGLQLALAGERERRGDPDGAAAGLRRLLDADPGDERAAQQLIRLLLRLGRRSEALRVHERLARVLRDELGVEPAEATFALGRELTAAPPAEAAAGTATFLLTDIEGSVPLWEQDAEAMRRALARHDALLEGCVALHGGAVVGPRGEGDSRFAVFAQAGDAVAAACTIQRALLAERWPTPVPLRVRVGIHTGEAVERAGDYYGPAVNRCARLRGLAHGGQVLLSEATAGLARDALPPEVSLRELGEHRLRGLERPERVFQLVHPALPAAFPPLAGAGRRSSNLPAPATPLIGRQREVAAARQLLLRDEVGLVTLTGPAGTGKTRLALEVANTLTDEFRDGVYFVALAPIDEPELVASAVARAVGLQEAGGTPLEERLKGYLRDRHLLLVLDNFEQVLAAAPLVSELLRSCVTLKALVTSRAILQLYGEYDFPVPPLALPESDNPSSPEDLVRYSAVMLFVQRAMAVKPDFAITASNADAVAAVCARLDGLPLAIELAAARISLLPPRAILARMGPAGGPGPLQLLTAGARDLPTRHQTLRGAIGWSYDLLDAGEQALFRRLAVFVGGFTLPAAAAVSTLGEEAGDQRRDQLSSTSVRQPDALEGVASLVAKSLLQQKGEDLSGEPRFSMLETVRDYGLERLEASGERGLLRRRHAEYFLSLAEEGERKIGGPEQVEWLAHLDEEHPNLRAALAWSLLTDEGDATLGLRLAGALWLFWFRRGYFSEGSRWLQHALAANDDAPAPARAKLLTGDGSLARMRGEYPRAEALLEAGAALWRELRDAEGLAWALSHLGLVKQWLGFLDEGVELLEESLALRRPLGDKRGIARSLFNLSVAEDFRQNYARATVLYEETLAAQRGVGDHWGMGRVLGYLGKVALVQGDPERAEALCEEGLPLSREVGDNWGVALCVAGLGGVAAARGDSERATAHLKESLVMFRDVGAQERVAECLQELASLACSWLEAEQATRLSAAAEAIQQSIGLAVWPAARARRDQDLAVARARLGEAAFARAWLEGLSMTGKQAIDYALTLPHSGSDRAAGFDRPSADAQTSPLTRRE